MPNTESPSRALTWPKPGSWPVAVVFFLLFFFYVGLRIEPAILQFHSGPLYFLRADFAKPFLNHPGGLTDYGAAGLAQLFYNNWLGAGVFTMLAAVLYLLTGRGLAPISGGTLGAAPFIPAFLLLIMSSRPECQPLAVGLGLLLGLAITAGYIRLPQSVAWLRFGISWISSGFLFYVSGLWACLLFGVLSAAFELLRGNNRLLGANCLFSALIGFLLLLWLPEAEPAKIVNPWGHGVPLLLVSTLYALIPLAVLTLAAFPKRLAPDAVAAHTGRGAAASQPRRWFENVVLRRSISAAIVLLGWSLVWLMFDNHRKALAQIDYYSDQKDYNRVLATARTLRTLDPSSEVRLHLALFHTGQLGENLFSYTNQVIWGVLPGMTQGLETCRPQVQTLLEMGQVNEAEHLAHEAWEWEGDRPDLLRALATINILKNRPKAALVFLNLLQQSPFQRTVAADYISKVEADAALTGEKDLAEIRSRNVKTDLPHSDLPTELLMLQLLHSNSRNQMAYEYVMAHYLLIGDMEKLVEKLGGLDDFGFTAIPRHYEEAILLFQRLKATRVDLKGRQIRPATVQKFQSFIAAMNRGESKTSEGQKLLARDFGDTFWFFYYCTATSSAKQPR